MVSKMAKSRGAKVDVICPCGEKFEAREADIKRGWGKFCSKSCKAKDFFGEKVAPKEKSDFETWWYNEGSKPPEYKKCNSDSDDDGNCHRCFKNKTGCIQKIDDVEEHTKKMCKIAWENGAYKASTMFGFDLARKGGDEMAMCMVEVKEGELIYTPIEPKDFYKYYEASDD